MDYHTLIIRKNGDFEDTHRGVLIFVYVPLGPEFCKQLHFID